MSTSSRPSTRRTDPTRTVTLRREYRRALWAPLNELKRKIRTGLIERGSLDMAINEEMPVFRFESDEVAVDHFADWLASEQRSGFLEVVDERDNRFVRTAYERGTRHADSQLRRAGVDPERAGISDVFREAVREEKLQQLYTRNFELLREIDSDMQSAMRSELSRGLAAGENPRKIARRLTDRVDKIGRHRADLVSRTEIINSHAEGALDRYEEADVGRVTLRAEVLTAGDDRTCDRCASISGEVMEIDDVRGGTFSFDGQDWPIKPPIHPNCRCTIVPVTT